MRAAQQESAFPVRVFHSQLLLSFLEQLTQGPFLVLVVVQSRLVQQALAAVQLVVP